MVKGLTIKERKFSKEAVKTGNLTKAAMKAYTYKTYKSANVHACQIAQRPRVKSYIQKLLNQEDLTETKAVKELKKVVNLSDLQYYATKLKGIITTLQLHDSFPAQKTETLAKTESLTITLDNPDIDSKTKAKISHKMKS